MITKNKFYLKMIFTACICAIILTGCGSKYTVEEKSLVENQKENQETLENGVNRTSMEKSMEFSDESTEKIPEIVEVDWSEYFNGLNGTAVIYDAYIQLKVLLEKPMYFAFYAKCQYLQ